MELDEDGMEMKEMHVDLEIPSPQIKVKDHVSNRGSRHDMFHAHEVQSGRS